MRKIILFNMMTLDGFFEGTNHSLDWHNVDTEFNEFADEQLNSVDTLIFGRKTYDLMVSYWTTPAALTNDPVIANQMNSKSKIVFSKTMTKAEWNNTRLIKENIKVEMEKLKHLAGQDIIIMGSANLASTFRQLDLIDEYRIMINPIILGQGTPLFNQPPERLNLKLIKTKTFNSGNVLLYYEPKRDKKTTNR
jgi:dihydrofolate reductase